MPQIPGSVSPSSTAFDIFSEDFQPLAYSLVNVVLVQGAKGSNIANLPASAAFTLELHTWLRADSARSECILTFESPHIYSVSPAAGAGYGGVPLPNLLDGLYTAADNASFLIDMRIISMSVSAPLRLMPTLAVVALGRPASKAAR